MSTPKEVRSQIVQSVLKRGLTQLLTCIGTVTVDMKNLDVEVWDPSAAEQWGDYGAILALLRNLVAGSAGLSFEAQGTDIMEFFDGVSPKYGDRSELPTVIVSRIRVRVPNLSLLCKAVEDLSAMSETEDSAPDRSLSRTSTNFPSVQEFCVFKMPLNHETLSRSWLLFSIEEELNLLAERQLDIAISTVRELEYRIEGTQNNCLQSPRSEKVLIPCSVKSTISMADCSLEDFGATADDSEWPELDLSLPTLKASLGPSVVSNLQTLDSFRAVDANDSPDAYGDFVEAAPIVSLSFYQAVVTPAVLHRWSMTPSHSTNEGAGVNSRSFNVCMKPNDIEPDEIEFREDDAVPDPVLQFLDCCARRQIRFQNVIFRLRSGQSSFPNKPQVPFTFCCRRVQVDIDGVSKALDVLKAKVPNVTWRPSRSPGCLPRIETYIRYLPPDQLPNEMRRLELMLSFFRFPEIATLDLGIHKWLEKIKFIPRLGVQNKELRSSKAYLCGICKSTNCKPKCKRDADSVDRSIQCFRKYLTILNEMMRRHPSFFCPAVELRILRVGWRYSTNRPVSGVQFSRLVWQLNRFANATTEATKIVK
eukprot:Selendium_serpulae@DN6180_c0_g1_i1.p1